MHHVTTAVAPTGQLKRGGQVLAALLSCSVVSLLPLGAAWAQMVPPPEHALHQNTGDAPYTSVRLQLDRAKLDDTAQGPGLALRGRGFWPHWEGRIGVVLDRPVTPLKDSFTLAQPNQNTGLQLRSMHILSDYYLEGGFRATAGVVRGSSGQSWWASEGTGGGLNISLQRLDSLGLTAITASGGLNADQGLQTSPYVGAGYSNNLSVNGHLSAWRVNADLGLISTQTNGIGHLRQVFQGGRSLDDIVHDLQLRPVVKVSVGYSF